MKKTELEVEKELLEEIKSLESGKKETIEKARTLIPDLVIKEVNFNEALLVGILKDRKIYTPLKKFCEFLGVDFNGQYQRIKRDETLVRGMCKIHIPSDSGIQETLTLEISYLPLWLTGIKSQQCREEIRENLIEFKLKAKDVLADAFFGKRKDEISLLPENKDWALKRIHDRADQAKILEEHKMCIIEKLEKIYEEIAGVANLKKNTVGSKFFDFKEKGYDASKEKLPSLELEKNNGGSIEIKVK
ncbi:phage antirepressor N-terminal domain-containing protein [Fusobacterium ulcerans]|uniref:phage antirepressor N-terminal domain-containing protein n=1 Tax=Fusobacterium ulcerans TaxID=861 RepID=UPI00241BFDE0|nr:phage antirepressor N-terminal domain-containing protein [Fusobacterium ulcerans]